MSEEAGTSPICLMLNAPLVGLTSRDDPTLHAVDVEGMHLAMDTEPTFTARCGVAVAGLAPMTATSADGVREAVVPHPWPVKVADLAPGVTRCKGCIRRNERRRKGGYIT